MELICLMELNNCGFKTANLDELEKQGWSNYKIAPFGSSVQVVYYRKDKTDDDILIKVLLNGQEARLPIETGLAPYYHWQDVKRYYLRKLYAHEKLRFNYKQKKKEQTKNNENKISTQHTFYLLPLASWCSARSRHHQEAASLCCLQLQHISRQPLHTDAST